MPGRGRICFPSLLFVSRPILSSTDTSSCVYSLLNSVPAGAGIFLHQDTNFSISISLIESRIKPSPFTKFLVGMQTHTKIIFSYQKYENGKSCKYAFVKIFQVRFQPSDSYPGYFVIFQKVLLENQPYNNLLERNRKK